MKNNKIFQYAGSIAGICLFAVALFVIHHRLKHYHFSDIMSDIRQIPKLSLLAAVVLTLLNYFVLTLYDTLAIRHLRAPLKYPQIAMASFTGYAFTHNLNILGGSTVRYRIYSALGLSATDIAKLIVFCTITFWLGFFSIAGISFAFFLQQVPTVTHIPPAMIRPLGIVFLTIAAVYAIYISTGKKTLRFKGWELEKPSVSILVRQIIISCMDWLIACGVLYVLMPAGVTLNFAQFTGLFLLAQITGLSSNVPGGLGVFETVMLLLLAKFEMSSAIFGSLLVYRLTYYIIPFGFAAAILAIHELLANRHIIKQAGDVFEKWSSMITPGVLAMTSFIAGVVLLVSGALPATKGRIQFLKDVLPLEAIELSHFLASIAGAILLLLARSLQRRINAAYHLTIILLGVGIVFSLTKGFDYEEAIVLSVILLAFLPCRKEFYRKAAIFTKRFEALWFILIFIVVLCSLWVGFFSYRHIEYSNELWWKFTFHSDAPRFLRASSGVVIAVLLFAVMQLLLPAKPRISTATDDVLETVRQIVNASDKTDGNIALLGDKEFLFNEQKTAFIMYGVEGRSWITMGGPVGPESEWSELIWKFRELCDYYDGKPVFYHINNTHLEYYLDIGLSFLKLGEEAMVNLKEFTLEGAANRNLRSAHNKIQKLGYTFKIVPQENTTQIIDKLEVISDAWLKDKNTREKRFSIGCFDEKYIKHFPIATISKDGQIQAFANIWATGQKKELSIDLMRHTADCPNGIMDYLFAELLLWGKEQGYEWFSLGMAPLSGMAENELAPMWHKVGTFIFRQGEHFYNFQGLRQYKEKFNPVWQPRYIACPRGLMLPRILTNIVTIVSGGLTGIIKR
jgi:phosphatidylglycerol lysyltransferase